jgi:hypothetical protein
MSKPFTISESTWIKFNMYLFFFRPGILYLVFISLFILIPFVVTSAVNDMRSLMVLFLPVLLLLMLWTLVKSARRAYRTNQVFRGPNSVTVNPDGIEVTAPGIVARYDFSSIIKAYEFPSLLAIFPNSNAAVLIPKEALLPEELQRLKTGIPGRFKRGRFL